MTHIAPALDSIAVQIADLVYLGLLGRDVITAQRILGSIWAYQYVVLNTRETATGLSYPTAYEVLELWLRVSKGESVEGMI